MSRFTTNIENKKKFHENLHSIDERKNQNLKEEYEKLKSKMAASEIKRNKSIQSKIKQYKLNDERWENKLK